MIKRIAFLLCLLLTCIPHSAAQTDRPMILPFAEPPGVNTWLVGQFFGNTVDAYNFGDTWYRAGQGVHFGIDFYTACGTPVIAVAAGEVHAVDDPAFGSNPHNLVIVHRELGLATLYGHLGQTPNLVVGQSVQQGEVVAYSGEPQGICTSRPHLHLEVRSLDFKTAYNPVLFVEAPWHTLASIGPFTNPIFQQSFENPRRWVSLEDQPVVNFWDYKVNDYGDRTWPLSWEMRPPENATLSRDLGDLPLNADWTLRQLNTEFCCENPMWHPTHPNQLLVVDGQPASVFLYDVSTDAPPTPVYPAPPQVLSPDGQYETYRGHVHNLTTNETWYVETGGAIPAISADSSRLLWDTSAFAFVPNEEPPQVEFWVSDLNGENARRIWSQLGGYARWLDGTRVLIVTPISQQTPTTLTIFDTATDTFFTLGTWEWLREVTVAPGGGRLMFYLVQQPDPNANGIYTLETREGAVAEKLPFWGDWRWRDNQSVYFMPFNFHAGDTHLLAYYHLVSRELRYLTDQPFTIANGDWEVSADGNRIAFINGDGRLWLLEMIEG